MHLLIIGHTAHYERDGQIVGWGPTVKEVCWLAKAFDQVTHLACLHSGPVPESALPYDTDKVRFRFVPPAGGVTLAAKARVALIGPRYVQAILPCLRTADVVQVRCPGSLGMYGLLAASTWKGVKWAKYAGNWAASGRMAVSHRFQRDWLRRGLLGGPVTVNGSWPGQPGYVYTFDNPSLALDELVIARDAALTKQLQEPIQMVYVGRIAVEKGLGIALQVVQSLRDGGVHARRVNVTFDVLGDGPARARFETQAHQMGLDGVVRFHGWVPHQRVCEALRDAHFILLPSWASEGWPKVLSEAMAYGVVPIASQVSAIPQVLAEVGTGAALPFDDVSGYVRAIHEIVDRPGAWEEMVRAGLRAAPRFTFERYLLRLDEMLACSYGSSPFDSQIIGDSRSRWKAISGESFDAAS